MSFQWLNSFQHEMDKPADYAEKTLAAYKLGMNANGSIVGVSLQVGEACPEMAKLFDPETIYHPDDAPRVPLENCNAACQCVYRPVMAYQVDPELAETLKADAAARKKAARGKK